MKKKTAKTSEAAEAKLLPENTPLNRIVQRWPQLAKEIQRLQSPQPDLGADIVIQPEGLLLVLDELDKAQWSEEAALKVMEALVSETAHLASLRAESVVQWIRFHDKDDWEAIKDCIELLPPPEVTIIGRLPKRGSQKIVFLASWKLQQKTVVLKKVIGPVKIMQRELLAHPLSIQHPNIIKTYTARNAKGEDLLIEEYLDQVLRDDWQPSGVEQIALLLHDIGAALKYIDDLKYVHGDVKPDNIGYHRGRFILLDFGICRRAEEFDVETSATGSLRTRAPELLTKEGQHSTKSDVWALGAVVARLFCGAFPLVDNDEKVPRISEPAERDRFEEKLRARIATEYDNRISRILELASTKDARVKDILQKTLQRDPKHRPEPSAVIDAVKRHLGFAIPEFEVEMPWTSAPYKEIQILAAEWPDAESVMRLPPLRLNDLIQYVDALQGKLADAPREVRSLAKELKDRLHEEQKSRDEHGMHAVAAA